MSRAAFLLGGAALLAGCLRPATDASYRGEPIATVTGQLLVPPGRQVRGPVRLAVAWYPPEASARASRPRAIVPEELEYEASFPVNYRFDFYAPPPRDALSDFSGGVAALGVLIAYDDRNGNGALDPIPSGGGQLDKVLGSSFGSIFDLGRERDALLYLDGEASPGLEALAQGFNLVRADPSSGALRVLAFDTPLPLELLGLDELDVLICEDELTPRPPGPNRMGWCGLKPTPGLLRAEAFLFEHADETGARQLVEVKITNGEEFLDAAAVTVNGAAVSWDGARAAYVREAAGGSWTPGQAARLEARAPGYPDLAATCATPGAFDFTGPAPAPRRLQDFEVAWTASAGTRSYEVSVVSKTAPDAPPLFSSGPVSGTRLIVPRRDYVGDAFLTVVASGPPTGTPEGSLISAAYARTLSVTFAP